MVNNSPILGKVFDSNSYQLETGCGNLYVHLIYKENNLVEILVNLGRTGVCPMAHLSSLTKFISSVITKVPRIVMVEALTQASGHLCGSKLTCVDQLMRFILDEIIKGNKVIVNFDEDENNSTTFEAEEDSDE